MMRSRLFLVPAAIIAAAPVSAYAGAYYLTGEEAQALLFPGKTFTEDFRLLTDQQMNDIHEETGIDVTDRKVRAWRVSDGNWFFVDQVVGLDSEVSYAIGISAKGVVTGIEVMECWADYSGIRQPAWRAQFIGKKRGDFAAKGVIENISGATLSSLHITQGVSRILATFGIAIVPPPT